MSERARARAPDTGEVATARDKYHCPACGAEAHWNPAKHALVCPFCGTESPATLRARRRDGDRRARPRRGAAEPRRRPRAAGRRRRRQVRCQSCQAISVLRRRRRSAQRCEFCGSAALVPYEQVKDAFRPESLLPLKIAEPQAREAMRALVRRACGSPRTASAPRPLTDTVKGVYLPYWTFDAKASATGRPRRGPTTTSSRAARRSGACAGSTASGHVDHAFDDDLVVRLARRRPGAAARDRAVPDRTSSSRTIPATSRAGWSSDTRSTSSRPRSARGSRWTRRCTRLCAAQVPGDTQRNLVRARRLPGPHVQAHPRAACGSWPTPTAARSYQVVVNGVTGRIAGRRPWSWIKIGLAVLAGIVLLVILQHLG